MLITITAVANGSLIPPTGTHPNPVKNGDFTITGNPGAVAVGEGVDEETRWTFDFSAEPAYSFFTPAQGLSSAILTLSLTPRDSLITTDLVRIDILGFGPIAGPIQVLPLNVASTIQIDCSPKPPIRPPQSWPPWLPEPAAFPWLTAMTLSSPQPSLSSPNRLRPISTLSSSCVASRTARSSPRVLISLRSTCTILLTRPSACGKNLPWACLRRSRVPSRTFLIRSWDLMALLKSIPRTYSATSDPMSLCERLRDDRERHGTRCRRRLHGRRPRWPSRVHSYRTRPSAQGHSCCQDQPPPPPPGQPDLIPVPLPEGAGFCNITAQGLSVTVRNQGTGPAGASSRASLSPTDRSSTSRHHPSGPVPRLLCHPYPSRPIVSNSTAASASPSTPPTPLPNRMKVTTPPVAPASADVVN